MLEKSCKYCTKKLTNRFQKKYCSNKCQIDAQYRDYIASWKNGLNKGDRGIRTKNFSGHLKRFLLEKYDGKCCLCGWAKKHPVTGKVPIEIDHLDGNSENNLEKNLRLLCPNCHSLTTSFKNLNKGKGRIWRKEKYLKNLS
jgi:DNA-directed RNA polymerase subunit L